MEFSRSEYWSGSLFLLQGIFPTQGLKPRPAASGAGGLDGWMAREAPQGRLYCQHLCPRQASFLLSEPRSSAVPVLPATLSQRKEMVFLLILSVLNYNSLH